MEVEVVGSDSYGCSAYKTLFETIISDVGKATLIDKTKIILKPEIPLFIFSIRLINKPVNKVISDVASLRQEGNETHLSISDERYAPDILSQLWKNYGRDNVEQQTRFDLVVINGKEDIIAELQVSSGEEVKKDIIGALWRIMPEGIKVRHSIFDGKVITVIATEEIICPEMVKEGSTLHKSLGGVV
ncbi:MAG: methanogenesis marker 17 protein [archaeon]|nr:methanogenesis marker 17 protein [archaeon]